MEHLIYFMLAAAAAIFYIFQQYINRRTDGFILPSTILMLMWAAAIIASIIAQTAGLDEFGMGYGTTGPYLLMFVLVSICAFYFSNNFVTTRKVHWNFNASYIDYLLSKFKIFIYLSFLLGLLRIYIIVSFFGVESLYDYRQNAFLIGKMENAGGYSLVAQLSSYVYVIATFFIVLMAIRHALTTINFKQMGWYFILFATQALSLGGRMFVIDFISCYFFMFILIRARRTDLFKKNELMPFILAIVALLSMVMLLGVLRNDNNNKSSSEISSSDYFTKFLYLQDGIVYTSIVFNKVPELESIDLGRNVTSIGADKSNFASFKNRRDMEDFLPFVPGVIGPLYFDFGYWGSLVMWFFICLTIEVIAKNMQQKGTVFGLLLIFVLMRFFYDTPLLISGGRGLFRYLFVLALMYLSAGYYYQGFRKWFISNKVR